MAVAVWVRVEEMESDGMEGWGSRGQGGRGRLAAIAAVGLPGMRVWTAWQRQRRRVESEGGCEVDLMAAWPSSECEERGPVQHSQGSRHTPNRMQHSCRRGMTKLCGERGVVVVVVVVVLLLLLLLLLLLHSQLLRGERGECRLCYGQATTALSAQTANYCGSAALSVTPLTVTAQHSTAAQQQRHSSSATVTARRHPPAHRPTCMPPTSTGQRVELYDERTRSSAAHLRVSHPSRSSLPPPPTSSPLTSPSPALLIFSPLPTSPCRATTWWVSLQRR